MPDNDKNNIVGDVITAAVAFVIGWAIGKALEKYPWLRAVLGVLFAGFGVWATIMAISGQAGYLVWTAVCFILAALLISWSKKPARAANAASARFAALASPEGVAKLMEGTPVRSGSDELIGWTIQAAHVVPNTFRATEGNVWADVDLILANGHAAPAMFHADTAANTWEWRYRLWRSGPSGSVVPEPGQWLGRSCAPSLLPVPLLNPSCEPLAIDRPLMARSL